MLFFYVAASRHKTNIGSIKLSMLGLPLGLLRSMEPLVDPSILALLLAQLRIKAPLGRSNTPFLNSYWDCFATKQIG